MWAELRSIDRLEYTCQRPDGPDAEVFAEDVLSWGAFGRIVWLDDRPVVAIGAVQQWPGNFVGFAFATDEFPKVAVTATRFVRRVLLPTCRNMGMKRAEARTIVSHTESHRWLEVVGAVRESRLKSWGKHGEDFYVYRWD